MHESSNVPAVQLDTDTARGSAALVSRTEPGSRNREMDALDLLLVLFRRKKTILTVTAAAAILASIVSLLLPKMYTATTTILPPEQNQSAANVLVGQIGILSGLSSADLGLKNPADIFIAILKSRSVQDAIVKQFDLRRVYWVARNEDARKKLDNRSEIAAEKEGLISIGVSDPTPSGRRRWPTRTSTSCAP